MLRTLFGSFLLAIFAAVPALAQDTEFQRDPIEDYAVWFLSIALGFGICLILFSLFRYRGLVPGAVAWAVLVADYWYMPLTYAKGRA